MHDMKVYAAATNDANTEARVFIIDGDNVEFFDITNANGFVDGSLAYATRNLVLDRTGVFVPLVPVATSHRVTMASRDF